MQHQTLVVGFLVAAATSAIVTPIVRRVALRRDWVAHPGGRNVHAVKTPRVGGIAMVIAFVMPLLGLVLASPEVGSLLTGRGVLIGGLVAGALAMFAVGLYDDLRGMRAVHKLLTHLAVGALAWECGFRIDAVDLPIIGTLSMGIFSLPITVIWIAGIINAVNLIDGLDGLAAGVVFFAAVTNLVVAVLSGSPLVAIWMALLLGSVFGFLLFNFNPARIFMGDSGSYFLGFVLAVTSISGPFQKASFTVSVLAPLVALGVPIIDTLLAMIRRFLERRPLFAPDRGHIHHRLLDMGITHRRAVLIIYAVCVCLTGGSIAIALGRSWEVGIAFLLACMVLAGLVRFVGYFESINAKQRQKARIRGAETERLRRLVLELPARISAAQSERALLEVFDWVRQRAGLGYVEILHGEEVILKLPAGEETSLDVVTARFPLGHESNARNDVKFGWSSDVGDVSPQTDILLQVVVDSVVIGLTQLGSDLVPAPAPAPTEERRSTPTPTLAVATQARD